MNSPLQSSTALKSTRSNYIAKAHLGNRKGQLEHSTITYNRKQITLHACFLAPSVYYEIQYTNKRSNI